VAEGLQQFRINFRFFIACGNGMFLIHHTIKDKNDTLALVAVGLI